MMVMVGVVMRRRKKRRITSVRMQVALGVDKTIEGDGGGGEEIVP